MAAPIRGVLCAWVLILWGWFLLEGAQAVHAWESKCHGCVRHREKCAFLDTGKVWGVFVECRLFCEARRLAWFHSMKDYTFWLVPPTTPHNWCYTSACCISTPDLPFLGAEARRVRLSLMPSWHFPGAGHAAWAPQGHRALPCEKQPALATVPVSAPQIFHSVTHARVLRLMGGSQTSPLFPSQPPWGNTETHRYKFFVTL